MELRKFLEHMTQSPEVEIEWLDLLSQLEYVGCRKIVKGVPFTSVNADILQHIFEEGLHAYLLKRLVENKGKQEFTWDSSEFSEIGWRYIQQLDHEVAKLQPEGAYPLVSWTIEQRVLAMYPIYLAMTKDAEVRDVISQILIQEKRHGKQFAEMPFSAEQKTEALEIEKRLWSQFSEAIVSSLSTNPPQPEREAAPAFL